MVFAQSSQGTIVAIDAARGKRLWDTTVERGEAEHFRLLDLRGPPTIVDDIMFVPSTDGHLYALSVDGGDVLWKYAAGSAVVGRPFVTADSVYVLALEGGHAVDRKTGEKKWVWPTEDPAWFGFPIDGKVFAAEVEKRVVALDAESGETKWEVSADPNRYPATYDGERLFFGTQQRSVLAVGVHDELMQAEEILYPDKNWSGQPTSSPVVDKGRMYMNADDGKLHAFDIARPEKELWEASRTPAPAVVKGRVFVTGRIPDPRRNLGNPGDGLTILDAKTGEVEGSIQTAVNLNRPPLVFGDQVFACGDDLVVALDPMTMRASWTVRVRGVEWVAAR